MQVASTEYRRVSLARYMSESLLPSLSSSPGPSFVRYHSPYIVARAETDSIRDGGFAALFRLRSLCKGGVALPVCSSGTGSGTGSGTSSGACALGRALGRTLGRTRGGSSSGRTQGRTQGRTPRPRRRRSQGRAQGRIPRLRGRRALSFDVVLLRFRLRRT